MENNGWLARPLLPCFFSIPSAQQPWRPATRAIIASPHRALRPRCCCLLRLQQARVCHTVAMSPVGSVPAHGGGGEAEGHHASPCRPKQAAAPSPSRSRRRIPPPPLAHRAANVSGHAWTRGTAASPLPRYLHPQQWRVGWWPHEPGY